MTIDGVKVSPIGGLLVLLLFVIGGFRSQYQSRAPCVPLRLRAPLPVPKGRHKSYTTNFPITENPLSESENWVDGKAVGLDWTRIAAARGLVYGTESGTGIGHKAYDDSTALLAGSWGPNQTVEATVHSVDQNDGSFEEVELRVRSSLSAHIATGYEVLFRCLRTPRAYASIVRWDGPQGKFTYLAQKDGLQYGVSDDDLVKATIIGDVITGYINGVQVLRARDSTFSSGSPGIGFWLRRNSGIRAWFKIIKAPNTDYGFTSFAAWD